jgi:uncharacterized membrane protein YdfJ with MMPL/SSD domain
MLSLCGLLQVEQLVRNAAPAQRRMASFAAIGIGGPFAYDLFLYSQSQLLGDMSATAWAARGIVLLLLVPSLMFIFGKWSWWMPAGLERRLPRLSIEGPETPVADPA